MLKIIQRAMVTGVTLTLTACASVSVNTDYDHSTQFDQYRTYHLEPIAEKISLSPSTDNALHETLRASLARHGVSETSDNPDLHVVPHLSTQEKINVYQSSDIGYRGMPYRYGRYGMWAGAPMAYTDISQYTEGTLILDFVDAKTQKLVFRGIAKGTLSDQETNAERMKEAVDKIVQDYPRKIGP